MQLGGARFVAGTTLDEAVEVLRRLDDQGLLTNTTILGEHVEEEAEARAVVDAYEVVLDRLAAERLRTNVALKLTHLGLDFGEEVAYTNVEQVVRKAAAVGNFIRIDMEESKWVDATLRIYRRLREAGHDNVGTVLQAYLYRTENDLESLLELKPNLRLVKGAYLEPAEIAYPLKQDVDAAYERLLAADADGLLVRRGRDARRAADRTDDRPRAPERARARALRVPDALRRSAEPAARAAPAGVLGARGHALRAGVVPVPDAAPGRAAGERALRRAEPAQALTVDM